ncbi:MAG: hypothetical protein AAF481_03245 [Acidobacteriota bacterium]
MLRSKAVRALLVEEVGGLRVDRPIAEKGEAPDPAAESAAEREALAKASRKALGVALLDLVAVLVLFTFRPAETPFLDPGATEHGVFTLGILLITAHGGFRLAQYLQLRTIGRLHEEIEQRER